MITVEEATTVAKEASLSLSDASALMALAEDVDSAKALAAAFSAAPDEDEPTDPRELAKRVRS